ncbi:MAG TPA: alpha-ketoacid dehydrogenase subunit beta [Acidimicrobiales bacterium]|jgi:pyruvate dehydrogenase E1 component beta subunit
MSIAEGVRTLRYVEALREGLRQCLEEDDNVFVLGEDVGDYGGVFRATKGLIGEFGERRIIDTPLSEASVVGLATGAAAVGLRPVVDLMFMDFIGICMDQLANQMAKMRYMFGGKVTLPVTVLAFAGAGGGMGAQHSQSLEAWLCHVPGLKVVMPSGPAEAKGLLVASIRDDNPVIYIAHKRLLGRTAEVAEEAFALELGRACVKRVGKDLTIVAMGRMVEEALKAADTLEQAHGIGVEVIDPRTLQPLDTTTIVESVAKTHRCLVAHEAVRFGGIGAEIAAQIQEVAFDELDAPIHRVGAPFTPIPFNSGLERLHVPNKGDIVAEAERLLGLSPLQPDGSTSAGGLNGR